jgi:hypothetical protein
VNLSTQEDVCAIALSLPEVTESDSEFGFRVAGRKFVSLWRERVDPKKPKVPNAEVVVVHVADLGEKEGLLASEPAKFFTTAHYDGYKAVLVRLPKVDVEELTELITDSWRLQAPTRLVEELQSR